MMLITKKQSRNLYANIEAMAKDQPLNLENIKRTLDSQILSAQPEESETCLCGLDTRECGGCMDGELMPEESDKEDDWISVDERLPKDDEFISDWFWVKRQGGSPELMYGEWQTWKTPHEFAWQDPHTVGDHEGLHIEYYDDITHWRELIPPEEEK